MTISVKGANCGYVMMSTGILNVLKPALSPIKIGNINVFKNLR
jgi:hypothetical protein